MPRAALAGGESHHRVMKLYTSSYSPCNEREKQLHDYKILQLLCYHQLWRLKSSSTTFQFQRLEGTTFEDIAMLYVWDVQEFGWTI